MSISGNSVTSNLEEEGNSDILPATFVRGGTSKGIFLTKSNLPNDPSKWDPIFLGIMGSPDSQYGRQLNGMGGGISSLSKIMIISPPTSEERRNAGIDVEYTFAQVGVRDDSVDYSGNCGNLTSMIGVYAVDEGMCSPRRQVATGEGQYLGTVRSFNTNTQKVIDTTFPVSEKGVPLLNLPQATVAGVPGKASKIVLDFIDPGGARTGKLLPSGNAIDSLEINLPSSNLDSTSRIITIHASFVDATNPTVFVSFSELNKFLPMEEYVNSSESAAKQVNPILELIRQAGAVKMGLDPTAQAQPKIAILRSPHAPSDTDKGVHIICNALSMGVLHKAIPMTVGLCLGVASRVEGSIAWDIVHRQGASRQANGTYEKERKKEESGEGLVRIRHPGGLVDVGAEFDEATGEVRSAKVVRTGRRLMKGVVWY